MHVTIRRQQIDLPFEAEQSLLRQLTHALGRFAGRVRKVAAYLGDMNGPRGGVDKRCRVVAEVAGAAPVVVEARDSGLRRLFLRVSSRLAQAVRRQIDRRRGGRRHGARPELT